MHYKKTANIIGILAPSLLVTHFCSLRNVPRFARGDCIITLLDQILRFFFT